jgi:GT2 family glycosyltransferase
MLRPGLKTVSIVIVNWNAGSLLEECVLSLRTVVDQSRVLAEIIVVDNASLDDSVAFLAGLPDVGLIRNTNNRGFAAACNQGAAASRGELLLFFNPDCRLGEGSIEAAADFLETTPDVGVVSVALKNDEGRVWRSCHRCARPGYLYARAVGLAQVLPSRYDSAMLAWPHDDDRDVDHVIGAFYMIRRSLFERLAGFDERFHVYLEDLDLSLRVKQAGYRIRFLAGPVSYHKGGGTSERVKAMRIFLSTQSRILYAFKHFGEVHGWLHLLVTLACEPLCRMLMLLGRGQWGDLGGVWRAFRQLVGSLPATLARRHVSG